MKNNKIALGVIRRIIMLILLATSFPNMSFAQDSGIRAAASSTGAPMTPKEKYEIEKLQRENTKLDIEIQNGNRNPLTLAGFLNFLYENGALLAAVIAGIAGMVKYLSERSKERIQAEDQRFENIVAALGSEHLQERANAAVLLGTFLRKGYGRFYTQVFNLAASSLRAKDLNAEFDQSIYSMRNSLSVLFRDAYPLARDQIVATSGNSIIDTQSNLNAAHVMLSGSYLANADFSHAWFRGANFFRTSLKAADFTGANLERCSFQEAVLDEAVLRDVNLIGTSFDNASLRHAEITNGRADDVSFAGADLRHVMFIKTVLPRADFAEADLSEADFRDVDLRDSNIESADSLEGARFLGVRGLSPKQIDQCRKLGAVVHAFEGPILID
ncbi:MAG: hypothetical protein EOP62_01145 [Sphingomonadales bacterium]|nr:MAG: hypothetical protein EOP62_01145 [Sphingomonadales bacterium]